MPDADDAEVARLAEEIVERRGGLMDRLAEAEARKLRNPLAGAQLGDIFKVTFPSGVTSKLVVVDVTVGPNRPRLAVAWDYSVYSYLDDFPYEDGLWRYATFEKVTP